MRYLVQLIIPALIVVGVVYLVMRSRSAARAGDGGSDAGMVITILVLGAAVALGMAFALSTLLD
ncbi:MAG: hypothetical protein ACN6I7_01370 [bacterium]